MSVVIILFIRSFTSRQTLFSSSLPSFFFQFFSFKHFFHIFLTRRSLLHTHILSFSLSFSRSSSLFLSHSLSRTHALSLAHTVSHSLQARPVRITATRFAIFQASSSTNANTTRLHRIFVGEGFAFSGFP